MAHWETSRFFRRSTALAGRVQSSEERVLTSTKTRQSPSRKTRSISPRCERKFAVRNFNPAFFKWRFAALSPSSPRRRWSGEVARSFSMMLARKAITDLLRGGRRRSICVLGRERKGSLRHPRGRRARWCGFFGKEFQFDRAHGAERAPMNGTRAQGTKCGEMLRSRVALVIGESIVWILAIHL